MVGKQGFIRTMEAVIAILLVLGFLLYILPRRQVLAETTIPEGIESARNFILMEFLTNEEVRKCIENAGQGFCREATSYNYNGENCKDMIIEILDKHTIPGFKSHCEICPNVKPCTVYLDDDNRKKSIYPGAIFMYFSENSINPVKYVRIYFWRK